MGLRPARCYREITQHPYTRSAKKVMKKAFITGVPGSKIHSFTMGNLKKEYKIEVSLVAQEPKQLRHNALEAMRIAANQLISRLTKDDYFMKVRVYPHHVMRENALAAGAGADRFSSGMAHCFGKPIGRAARVKKGQKVCSLFVNPENTNYAKKAIKRGRMKLSGTYSILVEESKKRII